MGTERIDQLIGNRMSQFSSHRRVLLVDKCADTCLGMKRMLERRGYQITISHSAGRAVENATRNSTC